MHTVPGQPVGERLQVAGLDAATGAMAEQQGHERRPGPVGDESGLAVRGRHAPFVGGHTVSSRTPSGTSSSGSGSSSSGPLFLTALTIVETG